MARKFHDMRGLRLVGISLAAALWAGNASAQVSCSAARSHVGQLRPEIASALPQDARAEVLAAAGKASQDDASIAHVHTEFAAGAFLAGEFLFAAWSGLEAASRLWSADTVSNAGVHLAYLGRIDEAVVLLDCARQINPNFSYPLEALAILAQQRNDCAAARPLIDEAVGLDPGDINILYAQAVIAYKCGDQARAKTAIRSAAAYASGMAAAPMSWEGYLVLYVQHSSIGGFHAPPFIEEARKIIDPRPADSEAHPFLVHCFDKLDGMVEKGVQAGALVDRLWRVHGSPPGTEADELRERIEERKEGIRIGLRAFETMTAAGHVDTYAWNSILYDCVNAYFEAIVAYERILSTFTRHIVVASALHSTPDRVVRQMRPGTGKDGVVYLDSWIIYEERILALIEAFEPRYDPCNGSDDRVACIEAVEQAYCAEAVPIWVDFRDTLFSIANILEGQLPRAARDYVEYWGAVGRDAAAFAELSLSYMKQPQDLRGRVPPEVLASLPKEAQAQMAGAHDGPEYFAPQLRAAYDSYIGGVFTTVEHHLRRLDEQIGREIDRIPVVLDSLSVAYTCTQEPSRPQGIDMEIELLLSALREAGDYDARIGFDCDLSLGAYTITVEERDGVLDLKVSGNEDSLGGKFSVKAKSDLERWGAEVGYGHSDVLPVAGPVGPAGSVSVSIWAEGKYGGAPDYGARYKGKFGLGGGKSGVGKIACYGLQSEATINVRVLMARLRR